jgi:hypothetical protein
MPRLEGDFDRGNDHAERGEEPFGALPVLLVAIHTPLQIGEAPAVAVAHQPSHLRLQHAQIAQHPGFEFIHHAHRKYPKS